MLSYFICETVSSIFDILINFDLKTEAHEKIRIIVKIYLRT